MSHTKKQLEKRRTGITATDLVALVGASPYGRTAHDVWRSKVLADEATVVESEAMSLGNELEPIVLRRLAARRNLHVLPVDPETLTMRHPKVAHHLATPDALLGPTRLHAPEAIAQVKVVGLRAAHEWADDTDGDGAELVPEHVLVQCAWEMYVSHHPVEHVGALIGTEVRAYRLELTPPVAQLVEVLVDAADRFWRDHVLANKPPAVDGSDGSARMLRGLFPRSSALVKRASDEVELLAAAYFDARAGVEEAERHLETQKQLLITACGEAGGIVGEGWRLKYELRAGYEVTPKPYKVEPRRAFDLRKTDASARRRGKAA
ncbi:MAG TPA: YqaJ viral recombinase family protein [Polyangiaceae bacterium]|nr:YqaJ viral recombinase family protein [Polyangiaceae bacterium]